MTSFNTLDVKVQLPVGGDTTALENRFNTLDVKVQLYVENNRRRELSKVSIH